MQDERKTYSLGLLVEDRLGLTTVTGLLPWSCQRPAMFHSCKHGPAAAAACAPALSELEQISRQIIPSWILSPLAMLAPDLAKRHPNIRANRDRVAYARPCP